MRQFYSIVEKGATLSHQLTWSHYIELLKLEDINKLNYYINISINLNLSVRDLRYKIKNNEYERLDNKTKEKLILKEDNKVNDLIKNPILIRNNKNHKKITEKILKQLILEDLDNFLNELGEDFCYN